MKKFSLCLCLILWFTTGLAQVKNASYEGLIEGYSPSMGVTGRLIVQNVATGIDELYIIEISPDGRFAAKFPLRAPKECYIYFPFFSNNVYFEPGDHVVQHFDLSESPDVKTSFLGDSEAINNGLYKARDVVNVFRAYADAAVLDMKPDDYKAYIKAQEALAMKQLSQLKAAGALNEKAYHLASITVAYKAAIELMSYNVHREAAYRRIHQISSDSRAPVLEEVTMEPSYYDFLNSFDYSDPENLMSFHYGWFLNKLKFLDLIYTKADVHDLSLEITHLEAQDTLSKESQERLRWLKESVKLKRKVTTAGKFEEARMEVLTALISKDISLELEIMELQDICQNIDHNKLPLSSSAIEGLKPKFKNAFLLDYLQDLNEDLQETIRKTSGQKGFGDKSSTVSNSDSVFYDIISKYKGKVVFIDFWATWCSPCLAGIQEMAPMKEDLQKTGIVFVYITNNTSPLNAYNTLIPGIQGEHYRLSNDQFSRLSAQFSISGIPHYALVNRDGIVVNGNYRWQNAGQLKSTLLELSK